jgi:ligand-binding SRPBCC domain-containing protein
MKYRHTFRVRAPLADVAEFHRRSEGLGAITPPPIILRLHNVPEFVKEGDSMDFTMWLGPLPLRWLARIEDVSLNGFTDRQLRGPFEQWMHRHEFVAVDEKTTRVVDEINASLRKHPLWGLVGLGMWLGLPLLFAYRGWRTRRLLESEG